MGVGGCGCLGVTVYSKVHKSSYIFGLDYIPCHVQLFKVQLMYLDHNGTPQIAPFDHVRQQVVELMQSSPEPAQYQIGLLTSEHRDVWYQKRQRLMKGSGH